MRVDRPRDGKWVFVFLRAVWIDTVTPARAIAYSSQNGGEPCWCQDSTADRPQTLSLSNMCSKYSTRYHYCSVASTGPFHGRGRTRCRACRLPTRCFGHRCTARTADTSHARFVPSPRVQDEMSRAEHPTHWTMKHATIGV